MKELAFFGAGKIGKYVADYYLAQGYKVKCFIDNNQILWGTLVMGIPTLISGLYGMNVNSKGMPFASNPYGFGIVCTMSLVICIALLLLLKRKKML